MIYGTAAEDWEVLWRAVWQEGKGRWTPKRTGVELGLGCGEKGASKRLASPKGPSRAGGDWPWVLAEQSAVQWWRCSGRGVCVSGSPDRVSPVRVMVEKMASLISFLQLLLV